MEKKAGCKLFYWELVLDAKLNHNEVSAALKSSVRNVDGS